LRCEGADHILRRLKSDKSIIADLPDKTEIKAFCHLTRKQAALYQAAVAELEEKLKQSSDGIARRGLVLSTLMRLKQICNHPTQWLGGGAYDLFDRGDKVTVQAGEEGIRFLLVSGKPIEEPVAWYGPIVMNTEAELEQAYAELRNGTFIKQREQR
jgi:SNF2 family DNA or RNA helicase